MASVHKYPRHEWYEELCALGTLGELSVSEYEELQRHLAECGDCCVLYDDFRRVAAEDLGALAVPREGREEPEADGSYFDENELLKKFLERAKRETVAKLLPGEHVSQTKRTAPGKARRLSQWLQRPALSYGTLGLLLCAVAAMAAYRLKEVQVSPTLAGLHSQVNDWKNRAETNAAKQESAEQLLQRSEAEREALRKSLSEAQVRYAELQAQEKALQSDLVAARAQAEQKGQELQAANAATDEKNRQIAEFQTRIQMAVQRTEEQRRIAENLQAKLDWAQQAENKAASVTAESQGLTDLDAKALFGARDLHIVDVYDVGSNGKTRRTFGRVYYAEKKLLIFYAFDLQDRKRNGATAFQAWGYRQPDEQKPQNLGLFSLDDATANRWVLKVNNPRVLEHIDAVFVTAENPKGSPSPRGQRLMYANLATPPNHP
ncbi:MAG TPA: hypothetical protein VE778_01325 [Candidatus Bathyarchaeia archaeon]|jgi:hypothetical protein|nr:hypothetical protein [Candidatus Bathyarchaeia archaeon]